MTIRVNLSQMLQETFTGASKTQPERKQKRFFQHCLDYVEPVPQQMDPE
jgi:hypothetical protein